MSQTHVVDFGTWHPTTDPSLFEHFPNDGRTVATLHSDVLVYNTDGWVCAKKTTQKVRAKLQQQLGQDFDPRQIRWHKTVEAKKILGDQASQLVTFIHQHLIIHGLMSSLHILMHERR